MPSRWAVTRGTTCTRRGVAWEAWLVDVGHTLAGREFVNGWVMVKGWRCLVERVERQWLVKGSLVGRVDVKCSVARSVSRWTVVRHRFWSPKAASFADHKANYPWLLRTVSSSTRLKEQEKQTTISPLKSVFSGKHKKTNSCQQPKTCCDISQYSLVRTDNSG